MAQGDKQDYTGRGSIPLSNGDHCLDGDCIGPEFLSAVAPDGSFGATIVGFVVRDARGSFRSLSTIENDPCPAYLYGEALKLEQSKRICVPVIAGPITVALFDPCGQGAWLKCGSLWARVLTPQKYYAAFLRKSQDPFLRCELNQVDRGAQTNGERATMGQVEDAEERNEEAAEHNAVVSQSSSSLQRLLFEQSCVKELEALSNAPSLKSAHLNLPENPLRPGVVTTSSVRLAEAGRGEELEQGVSGTPKKETSASSLKNEDRRAGDESVGYPNVALTPSDIGSFDCMSGLPPEEKTFLSNQTSKISQKRHELLSTISDANCIMWNIAKERNEQKEAEALLLVKRVQKRKADDMQDQKESNDVTSGKVAKEENQPSIEVAHASQSEKAESEHPDEKIILTHRDTHWQNLVQTK